MVRESHEERMNHLASEIIEAMILKMTNTMEVVVDWFTNFLLNWLECKTIDDEEEKD